MLWHNTARRKRFSCAEVIMERKGIPAHTTPEAARVQDEIFRRMPPSRRLELALEMSDELRDVSAAGVRDRHPEYMEAQVRLAVIRLSLGEELFRQVYPGVDVRP
jgi:hypothetical protein